MNDKQEAVEIPDAFLPDLEPEIREDLFSKGEPMAFSFGTVFLEEDKEASDFFVLLEGSVRVLATSSGGTETTLAHLEAGAYFGEMSLLHEDAVSASVRAKSDGLAVRIPGERFLECCKEYQALERSLQEGARKRTLCNFFSYSTTFSALSKELQQHLVSKLEEIEYDEGAYIIREGDPPGSLYVLHEGKAKVVQEQEGKQRVLAYLRCGDFVGERALLLDESRAASVLCVTNVRVLALAPEAFHELCEMDETFAALLEKKIPEYSESDLPLPPLDFSILERGPDEDLLFVPSMESAPFEMKYFVDSSFPFVQQLYEHDCGLACLLGLLRWCGYRVPRSVLMRMAMFPTEGSTPATLIALAKQCGIRLDHRILNEADPSIVQLPALFHTNDEHWLLVYEQEGDMLTVSDPARGLFSLDSEKLARQWSGHVLECSTEKEGKPLSVSYHRSLFHLCFPDALWPSICLYIVILAGLYVAVPATLLWLLPHVAYSPFSQRLTASALFLLVGFFFLASKNFLHGQLLEFAGDVSVERGSEWFTAMIRDAHGDLRNFTARDQGTRVDAITRFRKELVLPCYRMCLALTTLVLGILAFIAIVPSMIPGIAICVAAGALLFMIRRHEGVMVSSEELRRQFVYEICEDVRKPLDLFRYYALPGIYQRWNSTFRYIERMTGAQDRKHLPSLFLTEALLLYLTLLWIVSGGMARLTIQTLSGLSGLLLIVGYSLYRAIEEYSAISHRQELLERLEDVHYVSKDLPAKKQLHAVRSVQGVLEAKEFALIAEDGKGLHAPCSFSLEPRKQYHFYIDDLELLLALTEFFSGELLEYVGHFHVDHVERRDVETGGFRSFIATMTEDATPFQGTLWENVSCFRDVEPRFIQKLMMELGVEKKIQQLPSGYDTYGKHSSVVYDMHLRRCLALARLVCQRPSVIVCRGAYFPTQEEIEFLKSWIPHDFVLISLSNTLPDEEKDIEFILFKDRHCVEQGTHDELMKSENFYFQRRRAS